MEWVDGRKESGWRRGWSRCCGEGSWR